MSGECSSSGGQEFINLNWVKRNVPYPKANKPTVKMEGSGVGTLLNCLW